jgi:hypothetical protein
LKNTPEPSKTGRPADRVDTISPLYAWRKAGRPMTAEIENLITNSIHTAFIKYPEGDGGPNMDYEWIPTEQSKHITKAILLDLEAGGYQIVKKT